MRAKQLSGEHKVATAIVINTPSTAVWDVLKNFGNVSDWTPTVTRSYYLSDKVTEIGTARHCEIQGFGEIQEYVTEWQEGKVFVYSLTSLGPLGTSNSSWWLSCIDEKMTKLGVTLRYDLRYGLLGRVLHKLVMRKKLEQAQYVENIYQNKSS